jgi:protoheme IX farnesyltransferase
MLKNNKQFKTAMIKSYYYLTKPGIIYANVMSAIAGFFLASKMHVDLILLLAMSVGLALVIASGCVFNNYIDRRIDEKMERTRSRALVKKTIPARDALLFGALLAFFGFGTLYNFTNSLATFVSLIGFFFYVVMYTIFKRKSVHGTVVGSISGAVPPVVGYTAVTNNFDIAALLLFILLALWQMPHFYSIALFRLKDYAATGLPILPVVKGIHTTKIYIISYIVAFIVTIPLLTYFMYTGYIYLAVVVTLSVAWLTIGIRGFKTQDTTVWAKKMFKFSLVVLLALCVMISIGI